MGIKDIEKAKAITKVRREIDRVIRRVHMQNQTGVIQIESTEESMVTIGMVGMGEIEINIGKVKG